jgi:hypothetical protein
MQRERGKVTKNLQIFVKSAAMAVHTLIRRLAMGWEREATYLATGAVTELRF